LKIFYEPLTLISLLAPLASFLTVCLTASRHRKLVAVLSISFMFIGLAAGVALLAGAWDQGAEITRLNWFTVGDYVFGADLVVSNRSLLMLVVVSFISFLVHAYSTAYMAGDPDWKKYFAMLGFFTFSMQGIVLTDNLLFLFIFWELVGFSSYMLIGHWTKKPEAGRAATKAFVMNRIGDAGFLVGVMIIWTTYETFSLSIILNSVPHAGWETAASLCIFCGVVGKSAQFPLFTWLPDAMEGPTPVSALIHAATMVAAGIYLLIRVFPLFTADALVVVAITGMITTLIGAFAALSQYDIKKILAYSTMSQLGLMILALGMGVVDAAMLHLVTHAFFKACLFLSAGMVIHSLAEAERSNPHFDTQDIRNMGGLRKRMPVAFLSFMLSGASLAGVPFFSGFLSKEAIITALFLHSNAFSYAMIVVILSVSFLTVIYTFRMIWFMFFGEERTALSLHIHKPALIMRLPVLILAGCSLWFLVSWNPLDFKTWMLPDSQHSPYAVWITLFSAVWVIAALLLSWYIFKKRGFTTGSLLRNAFYVDKFYEAITDTTIRLATRAVTVTERRGIDRTLHGIVYIQVILAHVAGWIDRTFVDGTVNAIARLTGLGGKVTRSFQGGNIQLYIFWSVFAIIILIIWAAK
jgi:NADH-quinone oxidoreductase subunit L